MNKKKYSGKKYKSKYPSHVYDLGQVISWIKDNPNSISGIAGAAGTAAEITADAIKTGKGIDTSAYQDEAEAFGNQLIKASSNEDLLNIWASTPQLQHKDKYDITGGTLAGDIVGGVGSAVGAAGKGALAGTSIAPGIGTIIGAGVGFIGNLIGQGFGAANNKKKIDALNNSIDVANSKRYASLDNAKKNLEAQQMANMLANYAAYGGPIFGPSFYDNGVAAYDIAKDNAYTKQLKAQDKDTASFSPIFGTSTYEFDEGGTLMSNNFNNGVTMINEGGTHENNPHEGVQMGIAPDGLPNLVEEGETIFDDYVFSNRLKVPKEVRNKYKLRGPKEMTFAEAFREAQKESEERPNDPISQDGLEHIAMILARTQEAVRGYEQATHQAAEGGHLFAVDGYMTHNPKGKEYFDALYANDSDYTKAIAYLEAHPEERDALIADIMAGKYDTDTEKRNNVTVNADNWKGFATDYLKGPVHNAVLSYVQRMNQQPAPQTVVEAAQEAAVSESPVVANRPSTKTVLNNTESEIGWEGSDPDEDMSSVNGRISSRRNSTERTGNLGADWLRYIEPFANLEAIASDMMGLTNTSTKFNYIPAYQDVAFTPIGNYIPVTHFDTRYAANQAAQQAAATRSAIMQSSAPSKWANLLAADYNAQIANGDLLRKAAMDDYTMMVNRETFNRGTNQYNSEGALKADMANQDARLKYGHAALQQAQMNDQADTLAWQGRAENIKALTESISNIGREATDRGQLDMLIDSGVFGTLSKKPYWWSDEKWNTYRNNNASTTTTAAKGGKLRKRKKGLTY